MSEHMLPVCVFEQKIPLIGCAGTGSNPQHPPLPPSSLSLFLCLAQHANKRQWDEKDSGNQPIPTLCHYRTDTLGVKRYGAEHQGELYITPFFIHLVSCLFYFFKPSRLIDTRCHNSHYSSNLWNTVIASGYICLSLGKCVKNQKLLSKVCSVSSRHQC